MPGQVSAQLEQLLMEAGFDIQPLCREIGAQRLAEAARSTEPQAGLAPARDGFPDPLSAEVAVPCVDQHMQAHLRGAGIGREPFERRVVDLARRMEQVDLGARGIGRRVGHFLEPGEERGDPDPGADPDLPRRPVIEGEAAIGALDGDRLSDLQRLGEFRGVIAELLGDESDLRVRRFPGRGDRVGMGAFKLVRGDKGELPGLVPGPAAAEADHGLERVHAGILAQFGDFPPDPPGAADRPEDRDQRGIAARQHQQRKNRAERGEPHRVIEQNHGVKDQHEIDDRQDTVGIAKQPVGNQFHQRDQQQHDRRVEGPFPEPLRGAAKRHQKGAHRLGDLRARTALGAGDKPCADRPFRRFRPEPVEDRQPEGADAEPLVQTVHLVEPAEPGFGPARPERQDHRDAHRRDRQRSRRLHEVIAQGEQVGGGEDAQVQQEPKGAHTAPKPPKQSQIGACHTLSFVVLPKGACDGGGGTMQPAGRHSGNHTRKHGAFVAPDQVFPVLRQRVSAASIRVARAPAAVRADFGERSACRPAHAALPRGGAAAGPGSARGLQLQPHPERRGEIFLHMGDGGLVHPGDAQDAQHRVGGRAGQRPGGRAGRNRLKLHRAVGIG
ncbi:hypothetical protein SDC9_35930 [bioreactor metagenome]|uniref:Uncharacterized protein n=1 Tax=bioreactor metagenome TaxID=1076179 RepID=A0A644VEY9_9ZZZZ